MNMLINEVFGVYADGVRLGVMSGVFGAVISLLVNNSKQPNFTTSILIVLTASTVSPCMYILLGVWIDEQRILLACSAAVGFIGRPVLRMILKISHLLADEPFKYLKESAAIIKGFWK